MRAVRSRDVLLRVWLGFLLVGGCVGPDEQSGLAEQSSDWVVGDAADAGFDAAALEQLAADIESGEFANTHALLVEHDGSLVFERDFSGSSDELWSGDVIAARVMGPDSLHDVRSISKNVTSALLGIALADGFESAVGRSIAEYLPELELGLEHQEVTLHHVLTMTAGLEHEGMQLNRASDPVRYVMSKPIVHEPGSTFNYSSGSSQVLATVISRLTGSMLREYALERLFTPLGITEFEWLGPPAWSSGDAAAGSGLRLKARDLAKIGSLYLHGGRWRGRQVVPEAWVSRSSMRHVAEAWIAAETIPRLSAAGKAAIKDAWWDDDTVVGYGYQWWVGELPSGERVVFGIGVGQQLLFVLPSERLVVTIFAGQYNALEPHSDRILKRVLAAR